MWFNEKYKCRFLISLSTFLLNIIVFRLVKNILQVIIARKDADLRPMQTCLMYIHCLFSERTTEADKQQTPGLQSSQTLTISE